MTNVELNYKIYDKELLAIVNVFEKWKVYLKGSIYLVKILINYKNLLYFIIIKKLNWRQTRWLEILIKYNFQIFYVKGLENEKANALSRKSEYYENKKYVFHVILITRELGLEYNKPQLAAIVKLEINN